MINSDSFVLTNAPLKEVIFELHWELDFIPQQKIYVDNGFEEAVMNFRNERQEEFRHFQLLAPSVIPVTFLNNKVTHRFFKEKGKHPLYQMGPGVFTVNDNNKNYSWEDFKTLIISGIQCLKKSYTNRELVLSKLELRYIDAVGCGIFGDINKFDFLRQNLKVNAESYTFVTGELADINFSKRFIISKDSYLNIAIATGKEKISNEDLIIWHTSVANKERISWNSLEEWINTAHLICSDTFKKMISPQLYEYFSR